jgi:nucleotide-binding universal stress UspA family protein
MRVLIGYDGSRAAMRAVEQAVECFGGHRDVEFVVVMAFQRPMTTADGAVAAFEAERDAAREALKEVAAQVVREGCRARARLVEGEPREVLESVTVEEEPDVVVVGARGESGLKKMLLGSVSTYAVKHLPTSVLVVRE